MTSIKDKKKINPFRTICEVHREIYDIIIKDKTISDELSNELIELLEDAYVMAKKMNAKLRQYKHNYDDGWWEEQREEILKEKMKKRNSSGINRRKK